jgi:hypothetical protein
MTRNERFWRTRAGTTQRVFNFGWWLQMLLPFFVILSIATMATVLWLRSTHRPLDAVAIGFLVGLAVVAVAAWFRSRSRFFSRTDALARLDVDLRLHNRLTCAHLGVGNWPAPISNARVRHQWQWRALFIPLTISAALVAAAFWIPVPAPDDGRTAIEEPGAWAEVESWLDSLERGELADPEAIASTREAVEALRNRPEEEWFSHRSLEAGDHLREDVRGAIQSLAAQLDTAANTLDLARQSDPANQALNDQLARDLSQASLALASGRLPLAAARLTELSDADLQKIRQLTPDEWKELKARLCNGAMTCRQCVGADGLEPLNAMIVAAGSPGVGGVTRGPGAAPLTMKDSHPDIDPASQEALSNDDLSRAALGDISGMQSAEHTVDETLWHGPIRNGGSASVGAGGDAVWTQSTTPDEQAVLGRFFSTTRE